MSQLVHDFFSDLRARAQITEKRRRRKKSCITFRRMSRRVYNARVSRARNEYNIALSKLTDGEHSVSVTEPTGVVHSVQLSVALQRLLYRADVLRALYNINNTGLTRELFEEFALPAFYSWRRQFAAAAAVVLQLPQTDALYSALFGKSGQLRARPRAYPDHQLFEALQGFLSSDGVLALLRTVLALQTVLLSAADTWYDLGLRGCSAEDPARDLATVRGHWSSQPDDPIEKLLMESLLQSQMLVKKSSGRGAPVKLEPLLQPAQLFHNAERLLHDIECDNQLLRGVAARIDQQPDCVQLDENAAVQRKQLGLWLKRQPNADPRRDYEAGGVLVARLLLMLSKRYNVKIHGRNRIAFRFSFLSELDGVRESSSSSSKEGQRHRHAAGARQRPLNAKSDLEVALDKVLSVRRQLKQRDRELKAQKKQIKTALRVLIEQHSSSSEEEEPQQQASSSSSD
jgi:hypothetical protein